MTGGHQQYSIIEADSLEDGLLQLCGKNESIVARKQLGGGCINEAFRLDLKQSGRFFCKQNRNSFEKMFRVEALGLSALASHSQKSGGPPVACPRAVIETPQSQFLLLDWIDEGRPQAFSWQEFGRKLACFHSADYVISGSVGSETRFGFSSDTYIGSNVQKNSLSSSWSDFFGQHRLGFQMWLAEKNGLVDDAMLVHFKRLIDRLPDLLPEPEHASLLHGDLWGGNCLCDSQGRMHLIDPAVYAGHHEADLAMLELFGGPPPSFWQAYSEVLPMSTEYPQRRDLYNLYHILNHANLFGGSYVASAKEIMRRYC